MLIGRQKEDCIPAKGLFITGTDTGVGKTVVAAAIARHMSRKNLSVAVLKPVTSSAVEKGGSLVSEDAELLRWASGCEAPVNLTSPYVLRDAIAPSEAARHEDREIRFEPIREAYEQLAASHDLVIVEGAGGLLVPLAQDLLVADLPVRLGLPMLIVARPDLGTVNHTLMTCECALARHIRVVGIIINNQACNPAAAEEYAPRLISELAAVPLLGVLPRIEARDDRDLVAKLAPAIAGILLETMLAAEVNCG